MVGRGEDCGGVEDCGGEDCGGGDGFAAARCQRGRALQAAEKLLRLRQHGTPPRCCQVARKHKEGGCGLERAVRVLCTHDVDDVMSARRPLDQSVLLATCNRRASGMQLVMTVRVPEAQPEGKLVARAQRQRCACDTHLFVARHHITAALPRQHQCKRCPRCKSPWAQRRVRGRALFWASLIASRHEMECIPTRIRAQMGTCELTRGYEIRRVRPRLHTLVSSHTP